jgi:NAD(P)-dependent dehydrogenase (short-subunit alcohol dehydrogenase family)
MLLHNLGGKEKDDSKAKGDAMKLKDKVAIVTGSARGLGKAYALRLADEGAKIVVAAIRDPEVTAKEIEEKGGTAIAVHTDVSSEKNTLEMAEKTIKTFGKIDILVNNAAIMPKRPVMQPSDQIAVEEWDRVMAVNVKGVWLCIKAVMPQMKRQGKGKIINISSTVFFAGPPLVLHYVASKAAVIGITRAMARELGDYGINVNCIAPGLTYSEAIIEAVEAGQLGQLPDLMLATQCFKCRVQPCDLLGAIVFFASNESDFITGQTLVVDGGSIMH